MVLIYKVSVVTKLLLENRHIVSFKLSRMFPGPSWPWYEMRSFECFQVKRGLTDRMENFAVLHMHKGKKDLHTDG